jgi:hypothetical protein
LLTLIDDRVRSSELWVEDQAWLTRLMSIVEQALKTPEIAPPLNVRLLINVFRGLRIRASSSRTRNGNN